MFALAAGRDGKLFVTSGFGAHIPNWTGYQITALSASGEYQRSVLPPSAETTANQWQQFGTESVMIDDRVTPLITSLSGRRFFGELVNRKTGMAVTPDGKILLLTGARIAAVTPEGKPYRLAVYAYRVRAVNQLGVTSGPSPYVLTIPSAPRSLFSRKKGNQCHLRWAANPERKIRGYRVYRMSGPKINGPGQKVARITREPVAAASFIDSEAGKNTQRYWVVAVDALGQEGIPSSPAWHNRQWRQFYVPFVGPWHQ